MHVRLGSLLFLAALTAIAYAADKEKTETVQADLRKMVNATTQGDYETLVGLTHPTAIKLMGGEEKAKGLLKSSLESLKKAGFTTELQEVGQPTYVEGKGARFAVLPYTMIVTGGGNKITSKTAVIGSSTDQGKTWKFLNVTEQGEEGLRAVLPELPAELKIPKQEQKIEPLK